MVLCSYCSKVVIVDVDVVVVVVVDGWVVGSW